MSDSARPQRARGIEVQEMDQETLLLDPETAHVCALNPTGGAVWALCDGERSIAEIAQLLGEATGAPADAVRADVDHFVAELGRLGFLRTAGSVPLPTRVVELLDALQTAVRRYHQEVTTPAALFRNSDPTDVAAALSAVARHRKRLLELGAGLGGLTILGDLLGYEAVGVEADSELATRARRLANDLDSTATFEAASFLPSDIDWPAPVRDQLDRYATGDDLAWMGDRLDLATFDCWLATPWPGTEDVVLQIFERCAPPDALLLVYTGSGHVRIRDRAHRQVVYAGSAQDTDVATLAAAAG